jgi:predicted DNA-binding transcriptional regulator AlpA
MKRIIIGEALVPNTFDDDRLIRKSEVCQILGIDGTTLWGWIKQGRFPAGIILNERSRIIVWKRSTVLEWIDQRQRGMGQAPIAANAKRRKRAARVQLKPAAERGLGT